MNTSNCDDSFVSIIVPVYNIAPYIYRCIESIVTQTYKNVEIILVDDGSTDASGYICDEWENNDNRIQVIHKLNGGLSSARNAGIDKATGKYLLFLDGDDYIEASMVEALLSRAITSKADIVVSGFNWVAEDGQKIKSEYMEECTFDESQYWKKLYPKFTKKDETDYTYYVVVWNKLYKKKLFDCIRFKEGKVHEDEFVLHRLLEKCGIVSTVGETYYNYVQRSSSIMHRESAESLGDAAEAILDRSLYLASKDFESESLAALSDVVTILAKASAMEDRRILNSRLSNYEMEVRRLLVGRNLRSTSFKALLKLLMFRISPALFYTSNKIKTKVTS